tara:strand:- start:369 stop:890 length:522 start_codon:yes stop_codon:yes gene_type:complete
MTKRRDFVAIPKKWLFSVNFQSLTKSETHLLLMLWAEAPGGLVPRIASRAAVELRLAHRPKRLGAMLLNLRNLGFLDDESATHYRLKDWDRYVGKYNQTAHKPNKKRAQTVRKKPTDPATYAEGSRAPAPPLSLREGDKGKKEQSPLGASLSSSPNYSPKVIELLEKHGEKAQ